MRGRVYTSVSTDDSNVWNTSPPSLAPNDFVHDPATVETLPQPFPFTEGMFTRLEPRIKLSRSRLVASSFVEDVVESQDLVEEEAGEEKESSPTVVGSLPIDSEVNKKPSEDDQKEKEMDLTPRRTSADLLPRNQPFRRNSTHHPHSSRPSSGSFGRAQAPTSILRSYPYLACRRTTDRAVGPPGGRRRTRRSEGRSRRQGGASDDTSG